MQQLPRKIYLSLGGHRAAQSKLLCFFKIAVNLVRCESFKTVVFTITISECENVLNLNSWKHDTLCVDFVNTLWSNTNKQKKEKTLKPWHKGNSLNLLKWKTIVFPPLHCLINLSPFTQPTLSSYSTSITMATVLLHQSAACWLCGVDFFSSYRKYKRLIKREQTFIWFGLLMFHWVVIGRIYEHSFQCSFIFLDKYAMIRLKMQDFQCLSLLNNGEQWAALCNL